MESTCKLCHLSTLFVLCAHGACIACRVGCACEGCLIDAELALGDDDPPEGECFGDDPPGALNGRT